MRKSTLFISAVLTTFVMALLASVAFAYQNIAKNEEQVTVQQPQPQVQVVANNQPTESPPPTDVPPTNFTPEQAAELAAQVLGRDDLFSVEVTDWNDETVYLVTFSSGDLVYVSLDGQIRSIGKVEVETVIVNSGGGGGGGGGGGRVNNTSQPSRSHEDDDHNEHEEHDDD